MPIIECGGRNDPSRPRSEFLVLEGPTVQVDIGFDPSFKYDGQPWATLPNSGRTNVPALLDTGATVSCIDSGLAEELKLPAIDKTKMSGVGGGHEFTIYAGHIIIPEMNFMLWGRFAGVHLAAGGQIHRSLLGRDLLQHMVLVYDGKGGGARLCY